MLPVDVDRAVMGFSLSIHIVLAAIGVALPLIMVALEFIGIRKKDSHYRLLVKRLSLVFLILFAVGSASGVLVALELFLLWPNFMALVGQVAILPVYMEVFAFFMETIFLGIYVYSWDRFKWKYAHMLTGIPIVIGSVLSAVFITILNAFMNTPVGFSIPAYLSSGVLTDLQPFAIFSSPAVMIEVTHAVAATYFAGSMVFAGYMAFMLARADTENTRKYYRKGLEVIFAISAIAVIATIITGVISIQSIALIQPEKYAAIEGNIYPHPYAAELIGGIPVNNSTALADYIAIPNLQSIMLNGTPSGTVPGLASYPRSTWPPLIVHFMFDMMFFLGVGLGLFFVFFYGMHLLKRDPFGNRSILYLIGLCSIMAVMIMEIGWIMAEFARQPWIIYGVMTVSQAANYSTDIFPVAAGIIAFYIAIIPVTILIINKILKNMPM